jgi:hypothetical protein
MLVFRKPGNRAARLLLALLFTIGTTVSVAALTQPPAQALTSCVTPQPTQVKLGSETAAEPTYNFTPHVTCTGLAAPASEACQTKGYGTAGDVAWECVEIFVNTNHSSDGGTVNIYAVGSYSCKTATQVYINCGFMSVLTVTALGGFPNADPVPGSAYGCSGNCPASGPAQVAGGHITLAGSSTPFPDDCDEVWGDNTTQFGHGPEVLAGASFTGDHSGPHVNICATDQI